MYLVAGYTPADPKSTSRYGKPHKPHLAIQRPDSEEIGDDERRSLIDAEMMLVYHGRSHRLGKAIDADSRRIWFDDIDPREINQHLYKLDHPSWFTMPSMRLVRADAELHDCVYTCDFNDDCVRGTISMYSADTVSFHDTSSARDRIAADVRYVPDREGMLPPSFVIAVRLYAPMNELTIRTPGRNSTRKAVGKATMVPGTAGAADVVDAADSG